jgi:hypothetical protein
MKTPVLEMLDLALTQAIERYMEMEEDEVYEAIAAEWPEQIAVLLVEAFFKTTCGNCCGMTEFIQIARIQGDSTYFVPMCGCERGKI